MKLKLSFLPDAGTDSCNGENTLFTSNECTISHCFKYNHQKIEAEFICQNKTYEANIEIHSDSCDCNKMEIQNCSVEVKRTSNKISTSTTASESMKSTKEPWLPTTQLMRTNQTKQSPTSDRATAQYNIIIGLGISVGLLVVVLVGMTIGWIWTCWIMSKRGHVIANLKRNTDR